MNKGTKLEGEGDATIPFHVIDTKSKVESPAVSQQIDIH